ncbi:MAG: tryptophan--tRNA ligase [Methanosarcinales archaeon]|nr:tryptophan--tRNA ligase [Methanosarcinales archaeon]
MNEINPWKSTSIDDYQKLFDEFGISPFDDLLPNIKHPHRFMRRGIIFGHRSYDSIVDAMNSGKPFGAMSGFMPSGRVHLGHKMVMEEIIWHQQQGGTVFMAVADMEAHSVRGISWDDCKSIGVEEYILSLIALGFEPEGGRIYSQSTSPEVRDLAFELGVKANFSEMSAIYGFNGETNIAHMVSATVQSADILHPQLQEFGGPRPVVIPVGADQDPHIRLTRGLADKVNRFHVFKGQQHNPYYSNENETDKNKEQQVWLVNIYSKLPAEELVKKEFKKAFKDIEKYLRNILIGNDEINRYTGHINIRCFSSDCEIILGKAQEIVKEVEKSIGGYAFMPPASTYHKFMTGLQGGKMSSSIPESIIALTEDPKTAAKKIMRAKTGGRMTLEEQKEQGGEPDECTVYELMLYHLVEDDNEVLEVKQQCLSGELMCGTCKKQAAELMEAFLVDHQRKREAAKERLPEFGIDYKF